MVAPPLLGRLVTPKNMFFLFNRYSLVTRESYDFSRLAHPWQTRRRQPPRMGQLITYFQTLIFFPSLATHWIMMHHFIREGWSIEDLFFICQIKGVTPLGRHTRPACNYLDFIFFLIVTHWIINHRLIRCNSRVYVIQFASWL